MRIGMTSSLFGHTFVLLWGVIAAPSLLQDDTKPINNIIVELVPVSEESILRLGSKDAEENLEEAAPAPSKVETENPIDAPNDINAQVNTLTESAREATHVEKQESEPIHTDSQPDLAELEAEPPVPEPKSIETATLLEEPDLIVLPKQKVKKKVDEKTEDVSEVAQSDPKEAVEVKNQSESKTFDLTEVASLLNKTDQTIGSDRKSEAKASIGQFKEEEVAELTISETELLRNHISSCWRQISGVEAAQDIIVKAEIELNRQGNVKNFKILNENNGGLFQAAAISAKSAVFKCQPYQMLPVEKFSQWSKIVFVFNPKELASG